MEPIHVGVSGINAVDNPGPGVGVARSLIEDAELDVHLVGLAYDAMEPGIYMDWLFDRNFMMPYPSGQADAMIERLLYIHEKYGLDCVIPNVDAELPIYIRYADELAGHGIRTMVPTREQFRLRAKDRIPGVAEMIQVQCPRTSAITSVGELVEAVDDIGLPVIVKGPFCKAYRVHTTREATAKYHSLVAEWGYPVIVQEVVTGEEMNVVALGDGEGNVMGITAIKKSWITAQGKIWTGVSIRHEKILAATRRFIREVKWRGPLELECIVTRDDEVYLIEINPRFPAWSYFATGIGQNLPGMIIRKLFGLEMREPADYPAGRLFVRYTYEMVTDMAPFHSMVTQGENCHE